MAEQYHGFWDGDALYGQVEFNRYFDSIYESGVAVNDDNTLQLTVTKTAANTVSVAAGGFAIVRGFFIYNPAAKTLNVSSGARQDRVAIKMDKTVRKVEIYVKQGTSSGPPALTRTDFVWELSLAKVIVTASGISSVVDERTDQNLCGAIRPKNLSEFNAWMKQIQSTWSSLIAGYDSTFNGKMNGYDTTFNNWFEQIQGKTWRETYIQDASTEPDDAPDGSIWIALNSN